MEYNDFVEFQERAFRGQDNHLLAAKLTISLSFSGFEAHDVLLTINHGPGFFIDQKQVEIDVLKNAGTPYRTSAWFYSEADALAPMSRVEVVASYVEVNPEFREPRVTTETTFVPFRVYNKLIPPIKEAEYKLTLGSAADTLTSTDIFGPLFAGYINPSSLNPNAISFQMNNGGNCTMLVAKSTNKYRIQSSCVEGLFPLLDQVDRVLREMSNGQKILSFQDALPLQDFFSIIDQLFICRERISKLTELISHKSDEMRIVQKRLLTRYKVNSKSPLSHSLCSSLAI